MSQAFHQISHIQICQKTWTYIQVGIIYLGRAICLSKYGNKVQRPYHIELQPYTEV